MEEAPSKTAQKSHVSQHFRAKSESDDTKSAPRYGTPRKPVSCPRKVPLPIGGELGNRCNTGAAPATVMKERRDKDH